MDVAMHGHGASMEEGEPPLFCFVLYLVEVLATIRDESHFQCDETIRYISRHLWILKFRRKQICLTQLQVGQTPGLCRPKMPSVFSHHHSIAQSLRSAKLYSTRLGTFDQSPARWQ
jgi:hypothetical protein